MAVGNPISLTDNVASRIISQIATESQTDFTISGGYRLNAISVYRNGVRLVSGRDYSAADGSTVVLLSGASLSDVLEFHIFDDFRVADALVSNASHQNIEGNLTIAGILTVTTLDLSSLTVSDSISIGGTLTYEDVTNVDSIGIITARTDLHVGAGLSVVGVSTFSGNVDLGSNANTDTITATGRFDSNLIPSSDDTRDIGSSSLEWRDLYVDGTGNIDSLVSGDGTFSTSLGIGTANPSNYGSDIKLALSSSGDTNLSIGAGVGKTSNVFFADGTSGDERYRGSIRYAHDTDSMRFHTAAVEKLRITSDGLVGIGTINPTSALEIRTTTTNAVTHYRNNASNGGAYFGVRATDLGAASAGEAYVYSYNTGINLLADGTGDINFATGGTASKVRIKSDGNVGINTTTPNAKLTVGSVDSPTFNRGAVAIKAVQDDNSIPTNIYLEEASGAEGYQLSIDSNGDLNFHNSGAAAPTVTFSDDDNVGIGTDNPTQKLVVKGTTSLMATNSTNQWMAYTYTDNTFRLNYNGAGADELTVTSDGDVLVGTTDATIYNNGDSDSEGIVLRGGEVIDIARKGDLQLTLNRQTNDGFHVGFFRSGSPKSYVATRNDAFCLDVNNSERLRVTSTGNIGIGSASPVTDVDISQKTGAVALPQGTTAQRPSGSSPYIRYNTTNSALEFYNGTSWVEIITDYFPTGSTIFG